MKNLQKLFRKRNKLIVGLMSGTSADGVDAVLLRVGGNGVATSFKQLAFINRTYPKGFRQFLLRNSRAETARLDQIARLNILIGEYFASAATAVVRRAGRRLSEVDLIGSHGQTVGHFPDRRRMFGKAIAATIQLGDPAVIAKRTGIVTVGDFRIADVAVGGSGAPLVPYVDYLLFRSASKNRMLLNIGGIANVTVLPRNCTLRNVMAFDTGPGNMVIDALMERFYNKSFDEDGRVARSGALVPSLLRWLMRHPYFRKHPPKSSGREMFGEQFVRDLVRMAGDVKKEKIVATATAFTALSIYDAYIRFVRPRVKLDELFVSGGGAHNPVVVDYLRGVFRGVSVESVESAGMSSDAKEAICFALLANEMVAGNPANVLGATGAKRMTVLGKICFP